MKIILSTTPMSLWYDIIQDAEGSCAIALKHELEAYLVLLLMRYTNQPNMIKKVIATELLNGLKQPSKQREQTLQEVGDTCLLFSGLFPKIAQKRLVKISYFVNLGQTAYSAISHSEEDVYDLLANQFVPVMDVLQSIRQHAKNSLLPFEAYDLWNDTGSQRALRVLKEYTSSIPHRTQK
jgi:hypothetical protein